MCKVKCKVKSVKRTIPALHLQRAPLIYVVAQVRFSAIVAIEKFVPEIQEQLRHKGFPRYLEGQVHEIAIQTDGPPKFSAVKRFEFQNKEATLGIVLQPSSVAIHTNNYTNYEAFEEYTKTALMTVHRVLNIGLSERIGLRYVNLIRLEPGEEWTDYLHKGLLGLAPGSVGVKKWTSASQFLGDTDVGQLAIRCSQSEQPIPPDLQTSSLNYSKPLPKGEVVTILDLDHFLERPADFKVAAAMAVLEQLHESLDKVFTTAVTMTALTKWGKVEDQHAKHA
jgi:uncharacterized protein (TIGR04255 family)